MIYTHRDLTPEDFAVFATEYAAAFPDVFEPNDNEEDRTMVTQNEGTEQMIPATIEAPIAEPEQPPNHMSPDAEPAEEWHAAIPFKLTFDDSKGVQVYLHTTVAGDGGLKIETEMISTTHQITQMYFAPKVFSEVVHDLAEWLVLENRIRHEAWYWIYLAGGLQGRVQQIKANPRLVGWTCNRMKPDVIGAGQDHLVFSNISAHPHGMD